MWYNIYRINREGNMKERFEEYSKEVEPVKYYKKYAWKTAIGLQMVDGLEPSEYLVKTAEKNINGDITIDEASNLISSYYKESELKQERTEEADKVSVRIAKILTEKSFTFSPAEFISIHKRLFEGVYSHAGRIRDYNITKEEWVLNGDTVIYGNAISLKETLEYDFKIEKDFNYKGLTTEEVISHISRFISNLWQIHIFGEGNTRTTAIFLIKYLERLGYNVTNDIFAENAWYFRNSLVRANYSNLVKGVFETTHFLKLFLRNLLLGEDNVLSNREMHVDYNKSEEQSKIKSQRNHLIFCVLRDNPNISLQDVADRIGKSLRTVKLAVKELQEEGKIERIGSKKKGTWITK